MFFSLDRKQAAGGKSIQLFSRITSATYLKMWISLARDNGMEQRFQAGNIDLEVLSTKKYFRKKLLEISGKASLTQPDLVQGRRSLLC